MRAQLSKIAANDIRELQREHGIICTPEEIIQLHLAGLEVERPGGGDRMDLIGIPVCVGTAWLFRITVAGSIWWQDMAWPWFKDSATFATYAFAFCLAHGRTEGKLQKLRNAADAAEEIKAWAAEINVTLAELADAIDRVVPPSAATLPRCPTCRQVLPDQIDRDAAAMRPTDWEGIIHEISAATGTDPAYWLFRTSADATIRAYYRARQVMASKCGYTIQGGPDALTEAIKRERSIIAEIVQNRRAAAAKAEAESQHPASDVGKPEANNG